MRVVIFQGQYGFFEKDELELSMPAIQNCIGLYAESDQHNYLLCAHFDTTVRLEENLQEIKQAAAMKGISMKGLKATIFGGGGKQSDLRCSSPGSYIGNVIVNFITSHGGFAHYSNQYYSGVIAKTFNFHYLGGCAITEGENPGDFMGGNTQAESLARQRIRLRPAEYSLPHAKMTDVSSLYSSSSSATE